MSKPEPYILNPQTKISDYKVIGGETLLTESFRLELDGEMGFAPKSLFVPLEVKRQEIESIVAEARLQFQVNLQAAENEGMLSEQLMEEDRITEEVVVRQLLDVVYGRINE